jgi:hypothetical protein
VVGQLVIQLCCCYCGADDSAAIEKDLAEGITVVADRYAFSGIAFSAAKVCVPS